MSCFRQHAFRLGRPSLEVKEVLWRPMAAIASMKDQHINGDLNLGGSLGCWRLGCVMLAACAACLDISKAASAMPATKEKRGG